MRSSEQRELEAVRLRAETLEQRYRALQAELEALREITASGDFADVARLRGELAAARARIATLELDHQVDLVSELRKQHDEDLDQVRRSSQIELDGARHELAETRDKLALHAALISTLKRELHEAKANAVTSTVTATAQLEARILELTEVNTAATERAEKIEQELAAASAQTIARLEQRLAAQDALAKIADQEFAGARAQIVELKARLEAGVIPLETATTRVSQLGAEVVALTEQLAAEQHRISQLEHRVSGARDVAEVDSANAEAAKAKRIAAEHAVSVRDAERRVEDAENRASGADIVAKAMAKDVVDLLRRVAEAETRVRVVTHELADAQQTTERAEAARADSAVLLDEARRRASDVEQRASQLDAELARRVAEVRNERDARLESIQRQLDAEQATALALVDRKNQLERDLVDLRARTSTANERAEAAEKRVIEREVEIETLRVRVQDFESGRVVSDTALEPALEAARKEIAALEAARRRTEASQQRDRKRSDDRVADADARTQAREQSLAELRAQLVTARERIFALEREVERADSVRSFAAETERAIAQLRRDLREARLNLTQTMLERDRLVVELRDSRGDSEATDLRALSRRARSETTEEAQRFGDGIDDDDG